MIYRLIHRGTVEERMMDMTKKKMLLEHLVVGKMKKSKLSQVCFCRLKLHSYYFYIRSEFKGRITKMILFCYLKWM